MGREVVAVGILEILRARASRVTSTDELLLLGTIMGRI